MNVENTQLPEGGPLDGRVRRQARWRHANKELPPTNPKTGDSECMLCMAVNESSPFVGWYNSKTGDWAVSHWKADSMPMRVLRWRDLPRTPKPVFT